MCKSAPTDEPFENNVHVMPETLADRAPSPQDIGENTTPFNPREPDPAGLRGAAVMERAPRQPDNQIRVGTTLAPKDGPARSTEGFE